MLFIWDIHITSKRQTALLDRINACIEKFPDERTIIFMWDYVYQFSYDRKALLWLFNLFTQLYKQWKHIYVVAWNHDWIADHFVYEEARQAFDLMQDNIDTSRQWLLRFITQPTFLHLEGQDVLVFPFTHHFEQEADIDPTSPFGALSKSVNRNERLSANANTVLRSMLHERRSRKDKTEKLLVIHHRYIINTAFPWQQAKFSYASPWLSQELLWMDDLLLVSWHLHQAFVDRNYLCTGSIWNTSSLEVNQQKRCFQADVSKSKLQAIPCTVNPYVMVDADEIEKVTSDIIISKAQEVRNEAFGLLQWWERMVTREEDSSPIDLSVITLLIRSSRWSYSDLEDYLAGGLVHSLADIKLKSVSARSGELLTDLEQSALALDRSISDWKSLLRTYIQRKYTDRAANYEQFLQELDLL